MAKFLKIMCVAFLIIEIIASAYLCSSVLPVFTAVENAYNAKASHPIPATGFNTTLFFGCLVISAFLFAFAWCFADIAQAANRYLKTNAKITKAAEQYINSNSDHPSENEESITHMLKTFRN